ncbi:MAG: VOC family protein [Acidobacteria bacterium]|nr:MAG: VOC family protein [Acidobacteriota bacterium]
MGQDERPAWGSITWADLTVPDADEVRDFYKSVVGWTTTEVDMGGYSDYCMNSPEDGATKAGVCHSRGVNAGLPPCWLIYISVPDLEVSIARCRELGGKVIAGPKDLGPSGRFCVIQDPAGAYAALFTPAE